MPIPSSARRCTPAVLAALLLALSVRAAPPASQPATDDRARLAVVGFDIAAEVDARDAWVAVAFEEVLTWKLRRSAQLCTMPTIRAHQGRMELTDDPNQPPPWPRVLGELGMTHWLSGRCTGTPASMSVTLRLARLSSAGGAVATTEIGPARLSDVLEGARTWILGELAPSAPASTAVPPPVMPTDSLTALEYFSRAVLAVRQERVAEALRLADEAIDVDPRFRAAHGLVAQLELRTGRAGRGAATRRLRAVLSSAQSGGDTLDRANAELALSMIAQADGFADGARVRAETALALATEARDVFGQIAALGWLGDLALAQAQALATADGDADRDAVRARLEDSRAWQQQLIALLEHIGDRLATMPALSKLAMTCERLGDAPAALALHERVLTLSRELGSKPHEATAWMQLGQHYRMRGQWSEAINATRRCAELAGEAAQPALHIALAELHAGAGQDAEALRYYESAHAALRDSPELMSQFVCLREMARMQRKLDRHADARRSLQDALDIARVLELPEREALEQELAALKRGD